MAGLLISGPAGAGKSAAARLERQQRGQAVVADFQAIYAALGLQERMEGGRYPERDVQDAYLLPLSEYVRRAIITGALGRELFVIVTNSDGAPERRQELLGLIGAGSTERVIDPGRAEVVSRLSVDGVLSQQCGQAIDRWYGRL